MSDRTPQDTGGRLPATEVAVVGGGVMGTSIAFHLAEAGVAVTLVEREALGSGSTSKAAGGVRAQFSDPLNTVLGARSLRAYERFGARPAAEIDLRQVGYLFLLDRESDLEAFAGHVAMQNALGVPSRLVDPDEAHRLSPLVDPDGLVGAAWSPTDGHATPEAVVQGYAAGARRHGAVLLTGCQVLGVTTRGGEVTGVETSRGHLPAATVVCAAGAWSREVGAMVGVDLPVTPYRRQVLLTAPADLPARLPMTIDFSSSLWFHREGRGLVLGMSSDAEPPGFHLGRDEAWLPGLAQVLERRAPQVAAMGVAGGWAGLYEVTPDHNALVGEAPQVSRFLYATGFSGHGFLMGPAVGEVVRDLVLRREPVIDVGPLDAGRFAAAVSRPEMYVV